MAIKTVIVLQESRTGSVRLEQKARITELEKAGLTLGPTWIEARDSKYIRTWATEAAAHDWISYQNSLVPPPVSAVVVID
jgi:hypothetical protein